MNGIKEMDTAIEDMKGEMTAFAREVLSLPAIAPESGGTGELEKASRILELISDWGFDSVERYDAPDDRVPSGIRPNIVLRIKGKDPSLPKLWTFVHMDVVPPGDLKKWTGDPWTLRVDGDRLIARGIEDNGQALVSSLFAARTVLKGKVRPERDICICLVSDEEVGSAKGMVFLVNEHRGLFSERDLFIVPDAGEPDGSLIEVSEKSIAWIKVSTYGKQVHASIPNKGINANLAAMRFLVTMHDELKERYPLKDELFDHPFSSFVPTKREPNVPNVNTIPGEDVSYFDSRILPQYDPDEVFSYLRSRADDFEREQGVRIELEKLQFERAAPPTPPDHPVVGMLKKAAKEVYGVDATARGIGGGTCAGILRRAGFPAAVWSRIEETAHMPDETALLSNYLGDCRVFLRLFLS
ncbi:MAG: M20 family metallo-hydrolase [Candidatus Thermoplasmatota archaeon]|jgi:succinyl-diaminopimelate desuccinylase|nr:M20 family metallo-hydrolase [Candidatus Thermoplasmatota archaeon]